MLGIRKFINSIFLRRAIFLISDTHFDHANIIRYCHRPFASVTEMNGTMVDNWNTTVKENDVVHFLGDWGYGPRHRPPSYWVGILNGEIKSIKGSHDNNRGRTISPRHRILKTKAHSFLLIHDPNNSGNWNGWIIHGHMHNNKMDKYPFINGHRKTINVSVELTGYKPVSLAYLEALNIDSIRWMRTTSNSPERW